MKKKKKLASIALSTVMTGSLLLSPISNAEEVDTNKIIIQEDAQIYTQDQKESPDKVSEEGKLIKEEADNEEIKTNETTKEETEDKVKKEENLIKEEKEAVDNEEIKTDETTTKEDKKESEGKVKEEENLVKEEKEVPNNEEINNDKIITKEDEKESKDKIKEEKELIKKEEKLEKENKKLEKNIIKFNKKSDLGFLKGKLSNKKEKNMDGAVEFFEENKDTFKINNPKEEFELISKKTDNLGYTHIKLQQMYKGTPLYGKQYIVHFDKEGSIYAVNGQIDNEIYDKFPKRRRRSLDIGQESAIEIAKSEVNADKIIGEPEVKYYFYELNESYIPVYEVRLGVLEPEAADWHIFIHAKTGAVVNKSNRMATASVKGSGTGVLGDEKEINLDYRNGKYYMIDDTRDGIQIRTYDASRLPQNEYWLKYFLPGDIMYDKDNRLDEEEYKAAVDAHKYAGYVYDYYKNNFGRNSIDDRGMDIVSSVHYGKNYVNAFWYENQMTYGDGDGKTAASLSGALDIVGHEMTHGVTEYEAGLEYEGQSGALNESFSDVFGTLIEFEYQPEKADYLCGEDVWTPDIQGDALRDLQDPGSSKAYRKQPSHMNDYVDTTDDHGGVHTNSGIPNKAAYLVMDSIGPEKTGQIYYRALTTYLTNKSNFYDARLALLQSAEDIYGSNSVEYNAVADAFDSVGIK
ncbi:M4 family metallopeptidase [Tepidibacter formicigenes]|jgi:Zn-dependent metalloprotease|uniref:Neutral metalloproteinase n=1 Tax=Tepidibacter formicigenes DSM 15518 TaxID=1123349 RepID=A0A1M6KPA8_9FIRM|nr:M4 family metallopeptidase [Tepidibacter formicigenes]SHJ60770.1 bacillolysin [Tepidibacter formicigenes DSM 15518]